MSDPFFKSEAEMFEDVLRREQLTSIQAEKTSLAIVHLHKATHVFKCYLEFKAKRNLENNGPPSLDERERWLVDFAIFLGRNVAQARTNAQEYIRRLKVSGQDTMCDVWQQKYDLGPLCPKCYFAASKCECAST